MKFNFSSSEFIPFFSPPGSINTLVASRTTPDSSARHVYSPASDRDRLVRVRVEEKVDMPVVIWLPSGPNHWMVGEPLTTSAVHTRVYVPPSAGVPLPVIVTVYSSIET